MSISQNASYVRLLSHKTWLALMAPKAKQYRAVNRSYSKMARNKKCHQCIGISKSVRGETISFIGCKFISFSKTPKMQSPYSFQWSVGDTQSVTKMPINFKSNDAMKSLPEKVNEHYCTISVISLRLADVPHLVERTSIESQSQSCCSSSSFLCNRCKISCDM